MTDEVTRWNARVRLALAAQSVDSTLTDTVLEEVAQHCADSGESPEDAFGMPEAYAATVVSERFPPEERLRHRGRQTPAATIRAALAPIGTAALVAGACLWVANGFTLALTPGGLVGSSFIAVALTCGYLAATASRSRRRAAGWVLLAAATVLGATAFTVLSRRAFGHLPAPVLCLLGLALLGWATRDKPTADPEGVTMQPRTDTQNTVGREHWLRRLPQLLEERHAVPRARAAELTREATDHLAATERAPEEEFGPVELYALRLSEEESPRARWWLRSDIQNATLAVILTGYLVGNLASGGPFWHTALASGALAVTLALLAVPLVRRQRESSPQR
ncbi:hypothetical protein OG883_10795 [Streptomyces sp. NBC_01142]|uniref:hypothetical protein n=1 Tax=Streptomyces sp. NBC_01142 TaxID=2975865 RepID=UPI002253F89A|nr:hypothetical protein [Streptomyces sp. NBC_01142]MCX4820388.1 hypothetical protein [Streptomyces sp. NBC_01142]